MKKMKCPKRRGRYSNPHIKDVRRTLLDLYKWKGGIYQDPIGWEEAPKGFKYPSPKNELDPKNPQVTWINHNSFLVSIDGIHLLTDPVWGERCSPFSFFGPKRRHDPGVEIDQLPTIDYVLISHNHYDHLCKKSVKALHRRFPDIVWLIPKGLKRWFRRLKIKNTIELQWWEEFIIESDSHPHLQIKATAVPTQHFSGRHFLNVNKSLWVGWVLEFFRDDQDIKRFYYVGDTGYNPHDFKAIGNHFGQMDLSLIPIGTYVPRIFMSPVHIEPFHAVKIHQEVNSKLSISMHWKTFNLADEPLNQPPYDLFSALNKQNVDPSTFRVLEPGIGINW